MADEGEALSGGDFDAFEVVLTIADSGDKKLEADVKSGLKIHALFACEMFPTMTYEQVRASAGTSDDKYTLGKNGVFTMIYGGDHNTLIHKYGVAEEQAIQAFERFDKKYPDLAAWRKQVQQMFQLISQERLGAKIQINEAHDYIGSMFGYKRYFTLEFQIIKALIDLAENIPEPWQKLKVKVLRRADKGQQTVSNATRSALYGAAFSVQSAVQRAAANHRIQAAGAKVTKVAQHRLWTKFQPVGFAPWQMRPMNIHDEILTVTKPELVPKVAVEIHECVEEFKSQVPLLSIGWGPMKSWSKNIQAEDVIAGNVPPDKLAAIRRGETWRWITNTSTELSTILP
jgi:DNA polymerase I-like protein with 3'-5' exonuclease and polymerase domains